MLVAETERSAVVGWIHVQGRQTLELGPFAEICALVVDETARGKGIGQGLSSAAELWSKQAGFLALYVRSNVRRDVAHRFYVRLGFARQKTAHAYMKALQGP